MRDPEDRRRIWELTPEEFEADYAELVEMHEEWKLYKAFVKAVKQADKKTTLELAPRILGILAEPSDGAYLPPKIRPRNMEEHRAAIEAEVEAQKKRRGKPQVLGPAYYKALSQIQKSRPS
jgi:hypothetical protein